MRAFESELFQTEEQAKKFAELVGGKVYDADFIGGCIVQYQSDIVLKRYVFKEYRDQAGTGSEKIFTDPVKAVEYARNEWERLVPSDKASYLSCGSRFRVFEIEIPGAKLGDYLEGTPNFNLDEYCSLDMWDYRKHSPCYESESDHVDIDDGSLINEQSEDIEATSDDNMLSILKDVVSEEKPEPEFDAQEELEI